MMSQMVQLDFCNRTSKRVFVVFMCMFIFGCASHHNEKEDRVNDGKSKDKNQARPM